MKNIKKYEDLTGSGSINESVNEMLDAAKVND